MYNIEGNISRVDTGPDLMLQKGGQVFTLVEATHGTRKNKRKFYVWKWREVRNLLKNFTTSPLSAEPGLEQTSLEQGHQFCPLWPVIGHTRLC